MRAFTIGRGFVVPLAGVESIKWLAMFCMLQEHLCRFVFGAFPLASFALGRLAFPLFAIALALTVPSDKASIARVVWRLIVWAAISEALRYPVIGFTQVNVLLSFALGIASGESIKTGWRAVPVLLVAIALGSFVEYGGYGVAFVALLRFYFVSLNSAALLGAMACVCLANQTLWPLLAFVIAPLVSHCPLDLPRSRGFFYYAYALQWPMMWGLRHAL